jgi:hypothetical protein
VWHNFFFEYSNSDTDGMSKIYGKNVASVYKTWSKHIYFKSVKIYKNYAEITNKYITTMI